MMPLLIRGLDLPDLHLRLNVIQTLQTAANDTLTISSRASVLADCMLRTAALKESDAAVRSLFRPIDCALTGK